MKVRQVLLRFGPGKLYGTGGQKNVLDLIWENIKDVLLDLARSQGPGQLAQGHIRKGGLSGTQKKKGIQPLGA